MNLKACLLLLFILYVFVYFMKVDAQTLEHGTTTRCRVAHVIIAYEESSNCGIELTISSSLSTAPITVFFHNESFPEECGQTFVRCNLTVFRDESSDKLVVIIPVVSGAALAMFSMENNTLVFLEQYVVVLDLPMYNCHLTNFFDRIESVTALCFNLSAPDSESRTVRYVTLEVNFNSLNLSIFHSRISSENHLVPDISQTVFFESEPRCLGDDVDRLFAFTVAGFELLSFHLINEPNVYEMFHNNDPVDCSNPRRLTRISTNELIAYCENSTMELDLCVLRSDTIVLDEFRQNFVQGVRYYCSEDKRTYVTEVDGNLTVTASLFNIPSDHTFVIPPDVNGIFIGDCIIADDEIYFIITSNDGGIHLVDLRQGSFTPLGNSDDVIPHVTYNSRNILYRNETHSLVHNISCPFSPTVLEIDSQYQLSAYFESEQTYLCVCQEPVDTTHQTTNEPTTTQITNNTTNEPTTEHTTVSTNEPTTEHTTVSTNELLMTTTEPSLTEITSHLTTNDSTTIVDETTGDPATSERLATSSLTLILVFAIIGLVVFIIFLILAISYICQKLIMNFHNKADVTCHPNQETTTNNRAVQMVVYNIMEKEGDESQRDMVPQNGSILNRVNPNSDVVEVHLEEELGTNFNDGHIKRCASESEFERRKFNNSDSMMEPADQGITVRSNSYPMLKTHEGEHGHSTPNQVLRQEKGGDKNRSVIHPGPVPTPSSYPVLPADLHANSSEGVHFNHDPLGNNGSNNVGDSGIHTEDGSVNNGDSSLSYEGNVLEESFRILDGQFDNQITTEFHQASNRY